MNDSYNNSERKNHQYTEPQPMQIQHHPQLSCYLPPPFMKRCCCFSLRTGSLILGWLGLLLTVFGTIILREIGPSLLENVIKRIRDDFYLANDQYSGNFPEENIPEELIENVINVINMVFLNLIILIIVIIALSDIFLLIGVYKKKTVLLKTFLIMTGMILGLRLIIIDEVMLCNFTFFMVFSFVFVYCYYIELQIEQRTTPVINSSPPSYKP